MKSITKRIISTLAICGALILEAGAAVFGSLGKAVNRANRVDAASQTANETFDLTSSNSNFAATGNETYFSQPYGYKKAGGTLTLNNYKDFTDIVSNSSNTINSIKVGFKGLRNGTNASKITIYLVNTSGTVVTTGDAYELVNKSAASNTAYVYHTFNSGFTNVTGFQMKVTTFGKNVLINEAYYEINYTSGSTPSTTYSVTYDGNGNTGGSAPVDGNSYSSGDLVTIKDNTGSLAKTDYTFAGWNTQADGNGTDYSAGGTFNITSNTTLFAKWTKKDEGETLVISSATIGVDGKASGAGIATNTTYGIYTFAPGGDGNKIYNQTTAGDTNNKAFKQDTSDGAIMIGKSGAYLYNSTAFSKDISKIELFSNGSASTNVTVSIDVGKTVLSSSIDSNHNFNEKLASKNYIYTCVNNLGSGYRFFRFQVNNNYSAQVQFKITFAAAPTTYTISFNNNDGSGSAESITKNLNESASLPTTGFSKTGYTFDGWNLEANKDAANAAYTTTYSGDSDVTLYAHYRDRVVSKIEVLSGPSKKSYYTGEDLDLSDLLVKATYDNGETDSTIVASQCTITGYNSSVTGDQTVTVTFGGKTATFKVTVVANSLVSIAVSGSYKTSFYSNEKFSFGGKVMATYQTGDPIDVTNSVSYKLGDTSLTIGTSTLPAGNNQTITISYGPAGNVKTATYQVDVTQIACNSFVLSGLTDSNTKFYTCDSFNHTGIVATATYNDSTSADVASSCTFKEIIETVPQDPDLTVAGTHTITVSYTFEGSTKTATYDITVTQYELLSIEVDASSAKTEFALGSEFNNEGLVVKATYNNGDIKNVTTGFTTSGYNSLLQGEQEITVSYGGKTDTYTIEVVTSEPEEVVTWKLVEDSANLVEGHKYAIANASGTFAMNTKGDANNRPGIAISIDDVAKTMVPTEPAEGGYPMQVFTLVKGSVENTWAFSIPNYSDTKSGFIYAASNSSNHLKTKQTLDEHGSFTISFNGSVASISANSSSNRHVMQFNPNSGNPIFSCYASADGTKYEDLRIYERTTTPGSAKLVGVTANCIKNPVLLNDVLSEGDFTFGAVYETGDIKYDEIGWDDVVATNLTVTSAKHIVSFSYTDDSSNTFEFDCEVNVTIPETITISYTGTSGNVTLDNTQTSITQFETYESTLSFATGYELNTATSYIKVNGGENILSSVLNDGTISFEVTDGPIEICINAKLKTFSVNVEGLGKGVTYDGDDTVTYGEFFYAELNLEAYYEVEEVTVKMNGVKQDDAYSNGVIKIESVTGPIVITSSDAKEITYEVKLSDTTPDYISLVDNVEDKNPVTSAKPSADFYAVVLIPDSATELPHDIVIKCDGATLAESAYEYGYDDQEVTYISIDKSFISGDIEIEILATHPNVTVSTVLDGLTVTELPSSVAYGGEVSGTLTAQDNRTLPASITVSGIDDVNYDPATGEFSFLAYAESEVTIQAYADWTNVPVDSTGLQNGLYVEVTSLPVNTAASFELKCTDDTIDLSSANITVTNGSYNPNTHKITIPADGVTGPIEISGTALPYTVHVSKLYDDNEIVFIDVSEEFPTYLGGNYVATILPQDGYENVQLKIEMNDSLLEEKDYDYDPETGELLIEGVTGDISIAASASKIPGPFDVVCEDDDHVTVTANKETVENNGSVTFTVVTDEHYHSTVTYQIGSGEVKTATLDAEGKFTVDNITNKITVTAVSAIDTSTVSYAYDDNSSVSGNLTVDYDGTLEFTVSVDDHYHVKDIVAEKKGGGEYSVKFDNEKGVYYIENVTTNVKIIVTSEIDSYSISGIGDDNVSVSPSEGTVNHGSSVTFTVTPSENYHVDTVTYVMGENDPVTATLDQDGKFTIEEVTGNVVVTASSEHDECNVSYVKDDHSTVTGDLTVAYGGRLEFEVSKDDHYNVDIVAEKKGGGEYLVQFDSEKGVYYIENVTVNVKIIVTTSIETNNVTYHIDDLSISYDGPNEVIYGENLVISDISTSEHHHVVVSYKIDGMEQAQEVEIINGVVTIENVTGPIDVYFSNEIDTVNVTVNGEHYSAEKTIENVNYGGKYSNSFTADDGYYIEKITYKIGDGAEQTVTGSDLVIENVTETLVITVYVKENKIVSLDVTDFTDEAYVGSTYTFDGVVTATMADGSTKVLEASKYNVSELDTSETGTKTITVSVGDITKDIEINVVEEPVPEPTIVSIEASDYDTEVIVGKDYTFNGKVTATLSDGTTVVLNATDYTVSEADTSVVGEITLTITCGDITTEIKVNAINEPVVATEIIVGDYNNTVDQGREYVFNGTVTIKFSDGSSKTEGYTVGKVDTSVPGKQTVKVSYDNLSVDITITVIQTETPVEPTATTAIIGGAVVGVAIIAAGMFFFLKKFKL